MTWNDYYDRFWDWSESTRISRISSLTDFGPTEQIVEILQEFADEKAAARLVKKALQGGVCFTPAQIIEFADYVTEEAVNEAIRCRQGRCTIDEYEALEGYSMDQALLDAVAKADRVYHEPVSEPDQKGSGFLAALLGFSLLRKRKTGHPGRCTGDCEHCPDHYGYRYGRWYYGKHHSYGCEFGGNDGSGKP